MLNNKYGCHHGSAKGNSVHLDSIPIIFCHVGSSEYLWRTLGCASITNPNVRRILIGDKANEKIAKSYGWLHIDISDLFSDRIQEFNARFVPISGAEHRNYRGDFFWLKFVFLRWFAVEEYCRRQGISEFFHFDSDTMILTELAQFVTSLRQLDGTCQCNGICLNGYVKFNTLFRYNTHTLDLFSNEHFLQNQREEFDSINPGFAFTEMRAFRDFLSCDGSDDLEIKHLENLLDNWWFDDAIMQEDSFAMARVPFWSGRIKRIYSRSGVIFGSHKEEGEIRFATLNLSWVPDHFFDWPFEVILNQSTRSFKWSLHLICMNFVAKTRMIISGILGIVKSV
jgi:hypothetical protein